MKKTKKKKRHESGKTKIIIGVVLGIVFLLFAALVVIKEKYTIKTVSVHGNVHYTKEQIQKMVIDSVWENNSLFLSLKYKHKEIKNIPFVERMDVEIESPDSVKIMVYEKALAGYIEYLDHYMYFDKDGIIVESSDRKTKGIPQVTGLDFGYVMLYEKLPVENEKIFAQVLNVTQLLTKHGIAADKIYFDSNYEMTLYFGKTRVMIGTNDYLDEKIFKLKIMFPDIEGKSGVLRLEGYSDTTKIISFEKD